MKAQINAPMRMIHTTLAVVLAVLALGSCMNGLLPVDEDAGGSVLVSIGAFSASTIEPAALSLRTASYRVTLGDGATVAPQVVPVESGDVVFPSVAAGPWTVTVEAFNGSDPTASDRIGAGTDTVDVVVGQTAKATVVIRPLSGDGLAELSVSWSANVVYDPSIVASLTDEQGVVFDISSTAGSGFTVDALAGTAAYSGGHSSGKYLLSVQLLDGDTVIWGDSDDIWLVSDGADPTPTPIATNHGWALTKADIRHAPEKATNLRYVRKDLSQVIVAWDDNSQVETGYVLRKTVDTNEDGQVDSDPVWSEVELRANATEAAIETVPDTQYIFEVQASNASGTSTSDRLVERTPAEASYSNEVITENTVWDSSSVHTVNGFVYVAEGYTLEIQPGTIVRFDADAYIKVKGTLKAIGTEQYPIYFTSSSPSPGYDDWEAIYFAPESVDAVLVGDVYSDGSTIQHAVVEHGNGLYIENSFPYIQNIAFRSCRGYHFDTGLGRTDYGKTGYGIVFLNMNAATSGAGRLVLDSLAVNGAMNNGKAEAGIYVNLEDTGAVADVVEIAIDNTAVTQSSSGVQADVGDPDSVLVITAADIVGNTNGFDLRSFGGSASVLSSRVTANDVGVKLHANSGSLSVDTGTIIENNETVGAVLSGSGGVVSVMNSTIQNNSQVGIRATTSGATTTIRSNAISGNGHHGIRNEGGTAVQPVTIEYNTIEQNGGEQEGSGLSLYSGWPSVQNNDIINQVGPSAIYLGDGLTDFLLTANNISNPSAEYDVRVEISRGTEFVSPSQGTDMPDEIDLSGNYWEPSLLGTMPINDLGDRVYDYWENQVTFARATAASQLATPASTTP